MVLTSFLLLHLDAALLTHTDHLSRHSCSDRIVRDILCHDRARRNDAAISDVYARQNQNTVSDPNIVSDTDRQLGFKPLFHHRNIRPLKTVISCDNRDIRPHHHTAANVTSTINFGIDADSGIVTKSHLCRKGSIFSQYLPVFHNRPASIFRKTGVKPSGQALSCYRKAVSASQPYDTAKHRVCALTLG